MAHLAREHLLGRNRWPRLGVRFWRGSNPLTITNEALPSQVGLAVLDEAQFVTDPSRGITVELILTYLISARERGIEPQLIVLSPVIGDLATDKLVTTKCPVRHG